MATPALAMPVNAAEELKYHLSDLNQRANVTVSASHQSRVSVESDTLGNEFSFSINPINRNTFLKRLAH